MHSLRSRRSRRALVGLFVCVGVLAACSGQTGREAHRAALRKTTTTTVAPGSAPVAPTLPLTPTPTPTTPPPADIGDGFDVSYDIGPQPTVPPEGCPGQGGEVVTIALSATPEPACVTANGAQVLRIANQLNTEIVFALDGIQETIAPNDSMTIGPLGEQLEAGRHTFWSPDHPGLMGIIDVA